MLTITFFIIKKIFHKSIENFILFKFVLYIIILRQQLFGLDNFAGNGSHAGGMSRRMRRDYMEFYLYRKIQPASSVKNAVYYFAYACSIVQSTFKVLKRHSHLNWFFSKVDMISMYGDFNKVGHPYFEFRMFHT